MESTTGTKESSVGKKHRTMIDLGIYLPPEFSQNRNFFFLQIFTSMTYGSVGFVHKIDLEIRPDLG